MILEGFWRWRVWWVEKEKKENQQKIADCWVFGDLCFGKELESNVVCGVLGFGIIGAVLIQWLEKIGAKDWVLGFCVGGVLMGLGLRRGEMQKWVERVRVCSPIMQVKKKKKTFW